RKTTRRILHGTTLSIRTDLKIAAKRLTIRKEPTTMRRRTTLVVVALLATGMLWSGMRPAVSQQDNEPKQTLIIGYPTQGIIIEGTGPIAVRYKGIILVKIYPVSSNLVRKYGAGPIASAELGPSQRDVRQLPLGEYEVHFSMRDASELKTYILREVILRS